MASTKSDNPLESSNEPGGGEGGVAVVAEQNTQTASAAPSESSPDQTPSEANVPPPVETPGAPKDEKVDSGDGGSTVAEQAPQETPSRGRSSSRKSSKRSRTPSERSRSNSPRRFIPSLRRSSPKPKRNTEAPPPNPTDSAETATRSSNKSEKRKSFKRIRGLLKGESRSRRSTWRKSHHSHNSSNHPDDDNGEEKVLESADTNDLHAEDVPVSSIGVKGGGHDDVSTIYDVTVDEPSASTPRRTPSLPVKSRASQDASKGPDEGEEKFFLRMILLLMDIRTRRFELLQLEFDSDRAMVSDIMEQVPESVTVESFRGQHFDGIVTLNGDEKPPTQLLAEFCQGNDILAGIPKGISASEAARLARQILSNPKIAGMLLAGGIDIPLLHQHGMANREITVPQGEEVPNSFVTKSPVHLGGSLVFASILVVMVTIFLSYVHKFVATPIQPGHVVSPGIVLSKCGLNSLFGHCDDAYLQVESGKVLYYKGKDLEWAIHGPVCEQDQVTTSKACRRGLEFKTDGSLWLGGEPITWLLERHSETGNKTNTTNLLTPWPFSEVPKIKPWEVTAERLENGPVARIVVNNKKVTKKESETNTTRTISKELPLRPKLVCKDKDSCHLYQSRHRRIEIRLNTHLFPSWRSKAVEASQQTNSGSQQR